MHSRHWQNTLYLELKAVDMTAWNSSQTKELDLKGKQGGSCCFHGMSVANQFCVLACLRLGLSVGDVCVRFKISEGTCSHLFTTYLQRNSNCCSHSITQTD